MHGQTPVEMIGQPRCPEDARRRALRELPAPTPSAGVDAYRRERELALAADDRKRANYERFLAAKNRSAVVDYLPTTLDIENVSRCNFRCTMCSVSTWKKGCRAEDLTLDAFKSLIDDQYGLVEIKLQGLGEPTLQRDAYFEMIRYARARHIWVRTTTNASLLHLNDNIRKMVDSDPNEIQISIDGASKAVYESIRIGAVYDRVMENCRQLNAALDERGMRRTKMWTVVQKANHHELEDCVRLAAELGFKHHTLSLELVDWGLAEWRETNDGVSVEDQLQTEKLLPLIDLGASLGVEVRFWNTTEKYSVAAPEKLCPWPFFRAYVSSDMRVVPCCAIGNPDVYQIGPALDPADHESFTQHWHGPDFVAFRQAHLDGNIPAICKPCYADAAERTPAG